MNYVSVFYNILTMNNKRLQFQLISDVHLDDHKLPITVSDFITPKSDYLIIAGDLCSTTDLTRYKSILESFCKEFKYVFLVLGNHEFYSKYVNYERIKIELNSIQNSIQNLYILDDQSIDLPGNIRIYGTTLWSNIKTVESLRTKLPINSIEGEAGTSTWINRMHFNSLYKLENTIIQTQKDRKRLIVVSHYPPTKRNTVTNEHLKTKNNDYYVNNLDYLLSKDKVYLWLYGHTHVNSNFLTEGDTKVVSNQYKTKDYSKDIVFGVNYFKEGSDYCNYHERYINFNTVLN